MALEDTGERPAEGPEDAAQEGSQAASAGLMVIIHDSSALVRNSVAHDETVANLSSASQIAVLWQSYVSASCLVVSEDEATSHTPSPFRHLRLDSRVAFHRPAADSALYLGTRS